MTKIPLDRPWSTSPKRHSIRVSNVDLFASITYILLFGYIQVCIPVGCVPVDRLYYSGGWEGLASTGGGASTGSASTEGGGVHSLEGVYKLKEGASTGGGCIHWMGASGECMQGVHQGVHPRCTLLSVNRMTYTCENITFPHTPYVVGKNTFCHLPDGCSSTLSKRHLSITVFLSAPRSFTPN